MVAVALGIGMCGAIAVGDLPCMQDSERALTAAGTRTSDYPMKGAAKSHDSHRSMFSFQHKQH